MWAEPKRESFVKQIKRVYENYAQSKEKSLSMSKNVKNNFNKNIIKKMYDEIFDNL